MLNSQHFYHRTIRRNVISFGSIFKDITLVRYKKDTYDELDRFMVPLTYTGKENFLTRLLANPDLHKPDQILLPRMSFEMTNIRYDSTRKLSSFLSSFNKIPGNSTDISQQYNGVPYDMDFEVNLYVRNVEDGTQIIEQILPYFNPDYTLSMSFIDSMNITRDIPIILQDIRYDPAYQGPADTTTRILIWTLTFKMKTYFFGPVNTGKIIHQSTANTYIITDLHGGITELSVTDGFGDFKNDEIVYQGNNVPEATATGKVVSWDNISNLLILTPLNGTFVANANIHGSISNTDRGVTSYLPVDKLVDTIVVTPKPPTANLGDDFGFTEINTEYDY